jgi:hypothetical protein
LTPTQALAAQARQLRDSIRTLTRSGRLDAHTLALCERQALTLFAQLHASERDSGVTLSTVAPLLQAVITAAEQRDLPLSDETEGLIQTFKSVAITFTEMRPRRPSRPSLAAPQDPVGFSVFVDESGTPSFEETTQPVLCVAGVIVKDDAVQPFDAVARALLAEYDLPPETEFHAGTWLSIRRDDPVPTLTKARRHELLVRFLALGIERIEAIHQLAMSKEMVKREVRQRMEQQGLDAYMQTILWFAVTLDRGLLPIAMPAGYKYFYDQHTKEKEIRAVFRALTTEGQDPGLRLMGLKEGPTPLDSKTSRFIQVADVAAYYLSRYRDFEVRTLPPRSGLDKHERGIREAFALMQPRLLDFIGKDLCRTWSAKALASFRLKP